MRDCFSHNPTAIIPGFSPRTRHSASCRCLRTNQNPENLSEKHSDTLKNKIQKILLSATVDINMPHSEKNMQIIVGVSLRTSEPNHLKIMQCILRPSIHCIWALARRNLPKYVVTHFPKASLNNTTISKDLH